MATLVNGPVTSSDTGYYAIKYSKNLYLEGVVSNPINKILSENGVINREDSLQTKGGTVYMYNALKLAGQGATGDYDHYTNAQARQVSNRSLNIALNSAPDITWHMEGTQTNQYITYDIGSTNEEALADWTRSLISSAMLNQLASNTATSITQYTLSPNAFTAADALLRITGNNAASVPTYHYAGSAAGTAITTDASVNSGNPLSLKDFEFAVEVITSQQASAPTWQVLGNGNFAGIAIISQTGMNQLINENVTLGQGLQVAQIIYSNLNGGKTPGIMAEFMIPGIPLKFVVVPDSWLPRGVNLSTGAEVANTRRCVIVGKNALDVSFGAGYAPAGGKAIPGASIEFDTNFKPLNKMGYATAKMLWGCKKVQQTGVGAGNSTAYDLSTFVICHYSRT